MVSYQLLNIFQRFISELSLIRVYCLLTNFSESPNRTLNWYPPAIVFRATFQQIQSEPSSVRALSQVLHIYYTRD